MRPDFYTQLDKMPRLPNGKINRKALPEPTVKDEEYIAPATETEEKLTAGIQDMLRMEKISVTANLLTLGLTSLHAMRVSMAASQGMNAKVTVADIMRTPTIRQIAELVEKAKNSAVGSNALFKKRESDGGHDASPKSGNPLTAKTNPLKKNPLKK